ncbi:REP-associated tyrosine transposase [Sphingobacterium suaedae]|uniref:Transposase n=1 Tax=Sphingobacterium suaedae TaxID=1686402 RepID=A0ABW5KGS0_9SPHI
MSEKYKFHDADGLYFISFATVYWIDVFIRRSYFDLIIDSLAYCRKEKGMEIFAWCIMPSHLHLIFRAKDGNPGRLIKSLKVYTSKRIRIEIANNPQESRKEWLLGMMKHAGKRNSNVKDTQFWQQQNHPIELWSPEVIEQKLNYIHSNPVEAGFVEEAHHWKYSSARDYSGGKGVLDIDHV